MLEILSYFKKDENEGNYYGVLITITLILAIIRILIHMGLLKIEIQENPLLVYISPVLQAIIKLMPALVLCIHFIIGLFVKDKVKNQMFSYAVKKILCFLIFVWAMYHCFSACGIVNEDFEEIICMPFISKELLFIASFGTYFLILTFSLGDFILELYAYYYKSFKTE